MKNLFLLVAVISLFMLTNCAELHRSMYSGNKVSMPTGGNIYAGQSQSSVEQVMGRGPDVVSSGEFTCKNTFVLPFGVRPGMGTVEWVYISPNVSTVIYLDNGRVAKVYNAPTEKIRR